MAVSFRDFPQSRGFRAEVDLFDCEVEGEIPSGMNGTFYRVGPDYLYPPTYKNDIPFNGDGHIAMFRFSNGHVDYKSRYIHTQRYKAHVAARKALFGTYRNRYTDDPSVRHLSGGTANTHVIYHHGKLMALKEDSPPVVLDANTLDTLDDYYTFGGQLKSLTFTAHPKVDYETGEMIAFGYEAKGEATRDVNVFSVDKAGKITWQAWIEVPYTCMLHDFAITKSHVLFLVIPYVTSVEMLKAGEVHWAWDNTKPSWFGVMRRGGDGKDIRWFKGPERCATHTMGSFAEGDKIYFDMDMGNSGQFPFFPFLHGDSFNPEKAAGRVTRLSVDLSKKSESYDMEVMYPDVGALPRQDDRYHGIPYRIGFMPSMMIGARNGPRSTFIRFDHATRKTSVYDPGEGSMLQEPCFVPHSKDAPEGSGWIVGMVNRLTEGGRNDFVIVDAERMADGPVATVRLPCKVSGQIHGWWVPDWELPVA